MDKDQFINCYQSVKFQENENDVFSSAVTKRKCLAINFFGSAHLKEDNDTTGMLLKEDLYEYGKIIDNNDPNCVNNYSESALLMLQTQQNENKKQWKTSLHNIQLSQFVKPLPCCNNKDELDCKNLKITRKQIQQFQNSVKEYVQQNDIEQKRSEACKLEVPAIKKKNIQTNFFVNNSGAEINKPNTPIIKKQNYQDNFLVNKYETPKKQEFTNPPENNQFVNDKPKTNSFKTARDELQFQNTKKYGKNSAVISTEANHNYGAVKKSLGARKGNVYNKFQPPVRGKEEYEPHDAEQQQPDEEVDERLKNIDPKMIELIKNEIMDCGSQVAWEDIAGLELAKSTIQEIVVWPMLRPDIFTGLRRPPKGILLFGPPGTGKTLIGKCIASQSNSTFFSISASSLTSKWIGESEKMVRALFAVAKCHQPAVVFVDEIDSLLKQRNDSEHECTRRIKTEFLVQLDGAGTGDEDRVLIIGATNRPQELDEAARRRLVKRLYIPLPDEAARRQIIENLISSERHCLTEAEIEEIASSTEGYSGADVKNLCQEASLGPIRSIPPMQIAKINAEQVRPLNANDFKSALSRIKSSVSESDLDTYIAWDKKFGCGSAMH